MSQTTYSDEDNFSEVERERKRELRSNYVKSGILMSRKHKRWLEGRRAAEADAAAQRPGMVASQHISSPHSGFDATLDPPQYATQSNRENEKTPAKRDIHVYSEARRDWHPFEATFDTGTAENWISPDLAEQLGYPVQIVPTSSYYTFTGEILESSRILENVRWCIGNGTGPSTRSRYTNFRIASENAPFAVLFGRDIIFSEDIFKFNEAALILTKLDETEAEKKIKEENRKRVEEEARALSVARLSVGSSMSKLQDKGKSAKEKSEERAGRN